MMFCTRHKCLAHLHHIYKSKHGVCVCVSLMTEGGSYSLSVFLPFFLSFCLSVCLSVSPSIHPSFPPVTARSLWGQQGGGGGTGGEAPGGGENDG